MDKNTNKSGRILLYVAMFLAVIPFLQEQFKIIKLEPLKGAIETPVEKDFTLKEWFAGTYQEEEEKYLNASFGFRNLFIRLNNQLAFNLFNKAKANSVIIGKDNYLYETKYITAYYGEDFIGYDSIANRMKKLKFIQDTLAKINKQLVVVFTPSKASFYPEFLPYREDTTRGITNYEVHVEIAENKGISLINFNKYFVERKATSKYPLYPQYGIHWSDYAACIAADSMVRYIEKKRKIDMPNFYWNEIEMAQPRDLDYDIADGMNLLQKLTSFDMAYPNLQIESESGKVKPNLLVISDSFYLNIFLRFSKAFNTSDFWYYNNAVLPQTNNSPKFVGDLKLSDEIDKHDIFMIMGTDATMPGFGWGFIENMYNHFKGKDKYYSSPEWQKKLNDTKAYIKSDKKWMKLIEEKASKRNISVDSMLTLDASWILKNQR